MSASRPERHIPGVGTVYLTVSDQDRALAFYRDKLGFEVRTDIEFGEVALYRLLAHAGRSIARAMVVFVTVSAAVTSLNMVNQLGAPIVATDNSYVSAFGNEGAHALVLLLMDLQHYG